MMLWIIKFLQPNFIWIIGAFSLGGAICWLCSFRSILKEKDALNNIIDNSEGRGKYFYTKEAENLEKKKSYIFPNHLGLRISTLEKAAKKSEEESGLIKRAVMPGLTDMHELTLHNETGRFFTATMNTIISCLLICGILGTLMGVHIVISDKVAINDLVDKLEPSMHAVGFTILLTGLKGIYLWEVEQYLSQLDRFTLERLLPIFSPQKEDHERAAGKPQELFEKIDALGQTAQAVQRESKILIEEKTADLAIITSSTKAALLSNNSLEFISRNGETLAPPEYIEPTAADEAVLRRMCEITQQMESKTNELLRHLPTLS